MMSIVTDSPAAVVGYDAFVTVRWSDMDAFQHINHARMVTLLEEARIDWLLSEGSENSSLITSAFIADIHVKYRGQLRHSDSPLRVTMWIVKHRAVDFTIGYEVRGARAALTDPPAVTATTQMAVADVDAQRLRRITPTEREYLASWSRT
ncbi:thioesterase family protein [Rhodococcus sp. T2V]|uniref:acyl-CoA thioesterase n=1 Tax=Rhodococcus sp. T2V TaxID=3034164 RepID=UPI0023E3104D|nr:thioesterase family protein [Rhodococcus sp. T2V]MDF3310983.1 thioesterase family protein [Rhodococcus sp. T2V]